MKVEEKMHYKSNDQDLNEKRRSMSPMLKDRRKNQKCKPKEVDNKNTELKTTLQVGKNVNDLIILNSMFNDQ